MIPVGAVYRRIEAHEFFTRAEPGRSERTVERDGIGPCVDGNFTDGVSHIVRRRFRGERLAESDGHYPRGSGSEHVRPIIVDVTAHPQPLDIERNDDRIRAADRPEIIEAERPPEPATLPAFSRLVPWRAV